MGLCSHHSTYEHKCDCDLFSRSLFYVSPHFTRAVLCQKQKQLDHFALGWCAYFICLYVDYHQFKRWAWVLYSLILFSLIGLFFVPAVQNVHRWYRIPIINLSVQPSEYAKLVVVIMLSYILEMRKARISSKTTAFVACIIVGIPFLLILKEPDLGTALVLCPIALTIFISEISILH